MTKPRLYNPGQSPEFIKALARIPVDWYVSIILILMHWFWKSLFSEVTGWTIFVEWIRLFFKYYWIYCNLCDSITENLFSLKLKIHFWFCSVRYSRLIELIISNWNWNQMIEIFNHWRPIQYHTIKHFESSGAVIIKKLHNINWNNNEAKMLNIR